MINCVFEQDQVNEKMIIITLPSQSSSRFLTVGCHEHSQKKAEPTLGKQTCPSDQFLSFLLHLCCRIEDAAFPTLENLNPRDV